MNAPARFPRSARLLSAADFAALRSGSRRLSGRCYTAQCKPANGPGARLGLAVSRRVSKLAVERNRIKRIARDSFRRHRHLLGARDILLIANPSAAEADNASLHAELDQLWQRIATLNAPGATGTMRG
ncbi:MAG: ribonuclease P protein component [Dokdonella sp.]|uniref:ribonuclease P protein component n=1 Tax=Dokdonella sp. TaxID=2291710 RepID=UPI0025C31BFA|nr:ribonuclease P protein component [Dokdonella sp.]MBZ0223616.1 ribonuclease P protein component [Dokdonella sp.]MCC7254455.1 ribonuclease P protein component [Dokdonella sp.]